MRKLTVCGVALPAALWLAGLPAGPDAAMAQERIACGEQPYVVRPGDSLSAIAQRAYSSFNYQAIFEANADRLESAAVLQVGQPLRIPCLGAAADGGASEGEELAAAPAEVATDAAPSLPVIRQTTTRGTDPVLEPEPTRLAAAPAVRDLPADRPIRLLTGSDAGRFAHRDLPEGGMITDLVNRALMRVDPRRRSELTWNNDWDSHLDPLISSGEHDLAFPWHRPDCENAEAPASGSRRLCAGYVFSEPVYSVAIGYYAMAGSEAARTLSHARLQGLRLCRPAGSFSFDLEDAGLAEPQVKLRRPGDAGECFALLEAGEVDVVTLDRLVGEAAIRERGLEGRVTDIPALATRETLHIVGAASNPYSRAALDLIDQGLRMLRQEGVWFELTSRHRADRLMRQ